MIRGFPVLVVSAFSVVGAGCAAAVDFFVLTLVFTSITGLGLAAFLDASLTVIPALQRRFNWQWFQLLSTAIVSTPLLGPLYLAVSGGWIQLWRYYWARRVDCVTEVWQTLDTSIEPYDLKPVWNSVAELCERDGLRQYAWTLTPSSEDRLFRYRIKNSRNSVWYSVIYKARQPAIFPPYPLQAYWETPELSPIVSAQWVTNSVANAFVDVSPQLLEALISLAGPQSHVTEDDVLAFRTWFPALFVPPAPTTTADEKTTDRKVRDANDHVPDQKGWDPERDLLVGDHGRSAHGLVPEDVGQLSARELRRRKRAAAAVSVSGSGSTEPEAQHNDPILLVGRSDKSLQRIRLQL
jgi:hypothetical protein